MSDARRYLALLEPEYATAWVWSGPDATFRHHPARSDTAEVRIHQLGAGPEVPAGPEITVREALPILLVASVRPDGEHPAGTALAVWLAGDPIGHLVRNGWIERATITATSAVTVLCPVSKGAVAVPEDGELSDALEWILARG